MEKIFGIGLSKTGTTSLSGALNILGYKTNDYPSLLYFPHFLLGIKEKHLKNYDAFTDLPVVPFYKKLDHQYPGSKFILTVRDKESWLQSCQNYPRFNFPVYRLPFKVIKLRQLIYKTVHFNESKFSDAYDRHMDDVETYFKNRPGDLLKMNIIEGEGWEKLCNFLKQPVPKESFPFRNSQEHNYDGHFE